MNMDGTQGAQMVIVLDQGATLCTTSSTDKLPHDDTNSSSSNNSLDRQQQQQQQQQGVGGSQDNNPPYRTPSYKSATANVSKHSNEASTTNTAQYHHQQQQEQQEQQQQSGSVSTRVTGAANLQLPVTSKTRGDTSGASFRSTTALTDTEGIYHFDTSPTTPYDNNNNDDDNDNVHNKQRGVGSIAAVGGERRLSTVAVVENEAYGGNGKRERPTTAPARAVRYARTRARTASGGDNEEEEDEDDDGLLGASGESEELCVTGDGNTPEPMQLPRRLSEAFNSELSTDFLIYLNLQTSKIRKRASSKRRSKKRASSRRRRRRSSAVHAAEFALIDIQSREGSQASFRIPRSSAGTRDAVAHTHARDNDDNDEEQQLQAHATAAAPSADMLATCNDTQRPADAERVPSDTEMHLRALSTMKSREAACRETVILGADEFLHSESLNDDYSSLKTELVTLRRQLAEQCEVNFRLQRNLHTLDDNIGLLIHHRITVEDIDVKLFNYTFTLHKGKVITPKQTRVYGQLFKILQENPSYVAQLAHKLSISEIDDFLQTVMFSLFGTYEPREEHLLLKMFEHALQLEYSNAKDPGSVMRSNTAISRMMTTYTRRGLGQQYLKDALKAQVDLVYNLDDVPLETDPAKVYRELEGDSVDLPPMPASSEETFNIPQVKEAVEERAEMLQELTDRFIKAIARSVNTIPYGVRWLCKTIRNLCRSRFEGVNRDVIYSHVGGFFLLRYINPAIVSPEAFGIVHRKPSSYTRKTLTQIAKLLQNIANNTANRTVLMTILRPYVQQQRAQLNALFDDICDVDDFYDEHKLEMIDALTSMDRTLSITPNELSSVHKLLVKYVGQLDLEAADPLACIMQELPPPPDRISRDDNAVFQLKLESRFEPVVRRGSKLSLEAHEVSPEVLIRMKEEIARTKKAMLSMKDNFIRLTDRLESYQQYLDNVRGQSVSGSTLQTEFASVGYTESHSRRRRHRYHTPKVGNQGREYEKKTSQGRPAPCLCTVERKDRSP
ncbi:hypothetical protein PTSG_07384 [Salpingoeca rosetta]|uniref:Ras-GAP domain-containing protein n=1 Tax=Salpingoeca rosetta (strain ATCC 50818 / BSB-021) TaxID=946362 RepID=F2UIJ4_SALR5|nr:uncharacterized protein PTSG_07384 [Salpingoeca rosetta]EGD77043.1 hypothetical protein PTSG_07384 [Salpingoeca rosetta]|eukprot:XP_004990883.1 hypothetical protein PTSG_07384 [Salpingoeca rosetta]